MDVAYASARDRLGQTLCGKYHLDEVLGVGGTAVVYRATHRNGNRVAVKLLHHYLCQSREVSRRLMREAYLANLLEHPGTVRVLDDDTDEQGVAFLVLELLDGETLEERRVRLGGRLPVDEVLGYIDRLLEVLELAHEKQIVHRDIKPSNLFLTSDGTLKVLDFGIARFLDQHGAATATTTGQTIGTPAFMPPEQALSRPKEIDTQTDLWAVGATIFTLLSGELVHVAESSSEHLVKAATLHARSLACVLPGVPANVEALVARALRFERKERWASATEMRRELWRVRLDPGRPTGTTSAPPPSNSPSSFPTFIGRRPSDRLSLRETGMSLSGLPPAPDATSRRGVIVASIVAALLVGGAASFAISIPVTSTKAPTVRAVAASDNGAMPLPPSIDLGESALPGTPSTPRIANAPGVTTTTSATPPSTSTASTTNGSTAPPRPTASGPITKPHARKPPPAPSADVYRPF